MEHIWQHSNSHLETNKYMLDNEILCDVTFLTGSTKTPLKCHKFILASRSPVFYAMFCGSLAEPSDEITIPDIESDTFKLLVRFMYTNDCEVNADTVMALLYAAKKYDVLYLQQLCKKYLETSVNEENVCTVLDQTIVFEENDLKESCLTLISKKSKAILQSTTFKSLSRLGLRSVLGLEKMEVKEEDVFIACVSWAKNVCREADTDPKFDKNLRDALGDLLKLIRFPSMKIDAFMKTVSTRDILTDNEKIVIARDIVLGENGSGFNNVPRGKVAADCTIFRFSNIQKSATRWKHSNIVDGISFMVSQDAILTEVALFLPHTSSGEVSGSLEIYEENEKLLSQNVTLRYDSSEKFQFINLSTEIALKQNCTYSIKQMFAGSRTYYGESTIASCEENGVNVHFSNLKYGKSGNGTDMIKGQIYGLKLTI